MPLSSGSEEVRPCPCTTSHVAVIYYSSTGTVAELARRIADAAEHAGADVRFRRASELAPQAAIDANPAWAANAAATADVLEAHPRGRALGGRGHLRYPHPLRQCDRRSSSSTLDTLSGLWQQGRLADKVYSGFTASRHPARRPGVHPARALPAPSTTSAASSSPPGYTDPAKFTDGNPYGTSHGGGPDTPVDDEARTAAASRRSAW